jgi:hypothetical protein
MGNAIDYILGGGNCHVGIESAIIYLTSDKPRFNLDKLKQEGNIYVQSIAIEINYSFFWADFHSSNLVGWKSIPFKIFNNVGRYARLCVGHISCRNNHCD